MTLGSSLKIGPKIKFSYLLIFLPVYPIIGENKENDSESRDVSNVSLQHETGHCGIVHDYLKY